MINQSESQKKQLKPSQLRASLTKSPIKNLPTKAEAYNQNRIPEIPRHLGTLALNEKEADTSDRDPRMKLTANSRTTRFSSQNDNKSISPPSNTMRRRMKKSSRLLLLLLLPD